MRIGCRRSACGKSRLVVLTAALTVFLPLAGVAPAEAASARSAAVVSNGAWSWFQDPRAVHHVGQFDRTYVGYVTSAGDIEVLSIDNGTGRLTRTVIRPRFQADDHAAPGIIIAPNGSVVVFYSMHSGPNMYYRVSTRPEDISSFGPEMSIPTNTGTAYGFTYANPIYLADENRTYLFFRGGDFKPAMTSTTDFVSWTRAQTVVVPDDAGTSPRPYVKYATNGRDTILLAFDDGHPRNVATNSVYTLLLKNGVFRTADGKAVAVADPAQATPDVDGLPVHTTEIPPTYDGSGPAGRAWVHSAALDPGGAPIVAFATFPAGVAPVDHRYRYSRWNGTSWTSREFAGAGGSIDTTGLEPNYSGGMDLDQNDPSTLYASRQVGTSWRVERWHTPNGGVSFDPPVDLTPGSTVKNVRPVVPWGPPGDVQVLWMSGTYNFWENTPTRPNGYSTALYMSTTGPLPTTARISSSAPSVLPGQVFTIGARRVAGAQGANVPSTRAELWGATGTEALTLQATATADINGLVNFPRTQGANSRYEVRWPASGSWGPATTPEISVPMGSPSAVRVSVDRTAVRRGSPVLVGMRVVNRATNVGLPGVPVQLWQTVDGRTWVSKVSGTTDGTGLLRVVRNPTDPVTYQARFPGTRTWAASASGTVRVAMLR